LLPLAGTGSLAVETDHAPPGALHTESAGAKIGRYKLVQQFVEGGDLSFPAQTGKLRTPLPHDGRFSRF
jgi:hypothetical protein